MLTRTKGCYAARCGSAWLRYLVMSTGVNNLPAPLLCFWLSAVRLWAGGARWGRAFAPLDVRKGQSELSVLHHHQRQLPCHGPPWAPGEAPDALPPRTCCEHIQANRAAWFLLL